MKCHGLRTSGMKWVFMLAVQGCSTITYMRVSEPVQLESVVADAMAVTQETSSIALDCNASDPGERAVFCKNVKQDIEKSQRFTLYSADQSEKPDYQVKLQLVQKLEDGPGFWDTSFSLLTLSIYPQETRMFYEIRFTGSKTGSPDKLTRSLRCHTIRRFGGLYKLSAFVADWFRKPDMKEADGQHEQQEASQDLYYFLNNSLDDLRLSREGAAK